MDVVVVEAAVLAAGVVVAADGDVLAELGSPFEALLPVLSVNLLNLLLTNLPFVYCPLP